MQQTTALLHHSIDFMHVSVAACFKAGNGIAGLAQEQMRNLIDYAQRNTVIEAQSSPLSLTQRLFDDELHLAVRDTCVRATGQLIEAHATVLDAAKSVVDCSHAWLLGSVAAAAYTQTPPAATEAVAAGEARARRSADKNGD